MTASVQAAMEQASVALAKRDYLACESLCIDALGITRTARDWALYARILMPLQECRRQRRMIAAEGLIRLGSASLDLRSPEALPATGCLILTHPHTPADAAALLRNARRGQRFVEILLADNSLDASRWTLRSFATSLSALIPRAASSIHCVVDAPPPDWRDRWLAPGDACRLADGRTPADFFIDATEALGDAARAAAFAKPVLSDQLAVLELCLQVVDDHELIHQDLFRCARKLERQPAA